MKIIIIVLILALLFIGGIKAQPKVFDDLLEFRGNEIILKHTIKLAHPFYVTILKGSKIATVEE